LSSATAFRQGIYQFDWARRIVRWLDAMPNAALAIEVAPDRVAAARWSRTGSLEGYAVESLPVGALAPSAVVANIANGAAVKAAVTNVCNRLHARDEDVAMILPDTVIRVFVQHFEDFPRSAAEAVPMLRWKLKKSVPFEADETLISYMRQAPRETGIDVVTALARLRIIREYESLAEGIGLHPGVVLSSSLAAISLVEDEKPTLLARVSGSTLTTAIVRRGVLCGYRCTELSAHGVNLKPQIFSKRFFRWRRIIRTPGGKPFNPSALPGLARASLSLSGHSRKNSIATCGRCYTPQSLMDASRKMPVRWRSRTWKV